MRQNKQNVLPMSNEGRNAYVIEHITDALLELVEKKHLMTFQSVNWVIRRKSAELLFIETLAERKVY